MANQNDSLIARRRMALASKGKAAPALGPASVPDAVDTDAILPLAPQDDGAPVPPELIERAVALAATDLSRDLDQDDFVMPRIQVCQAMSKVARAGVPLGHWYHSVSGEDLGTTIWVVPVDVRKNRSYFKQGEGLLCSSFDLVQGRGTPGILCEGTLEQRLTLPADQRGCPLRLWPERGPGGQSGGRPPCGENYTFPILVLDRDNPEDGPTQRAMITFRASGVKTAKAINSLVLGKDFAWGEAIIELGVEEQSNNRGTYFVPVASFVGPVRGPSATKAQRFAASMSDEMIRVSVEADTGE